VPVSACQSSSAHVATVPSQIFLRVIKPGCAYGHKGKLCPSYARTASSRGEVSPCSAAFSLTHAQAGIASLRTAWWGLYCASASAYRLVIILSCNTLIGPRCSIRIRKEGEGGSFGRSWHVPPIYVPGEVPRAIDAYYPAREEEGRIICIPLGYCSRGTSSRLYLRNTESASHQC
jgi:hypothetical protein